MAVSISNPNLLTIIDKKTDRRFFGGSQSWYSTQWSRGAGCGPTCAANIFAYLAQTNTSLSPLYPYEDMSILNFSNHMEDVYKFITPGPMGINRVEMLSDGAMEFAKSRGVKLTPHIFYVFGNTVKGRSDISTLEEFVRGAFLCDCPLGFLNLTNGRVKNIQSWHWITITSAEIDKNQIFADASDEGEKISFDLRLWYLTTRLSGGLIYFTE